MGIKYREKYISQHTHMEENSPYKNLGGYLKKNGLQPVPIEDESVYKANYKYNNIEFSCLGQIKEDLEQFIFYVVAPVMVPEDKRLIAAEYITRANYGLRIGNIEMDFSDGEIRYKSSIDFEGEDLTDTMMRNIIEPSIRTMERYFHGLVAVIYDKQTPSEAIDMIEDSLSNWGYFIEGYA